MSEGKGPFKGIDKKTFEYASKIKTSGPYLSYLNKIETLPDEQQSFINKLISSSIVTLPFLLLIILAFQVYSYKKEINTFLNVTKQANKVIAYKNEISSHSRRLINSKELGEQSLFERELRAIVNGLGIKLQDLNVQSFDVTNATSEITRVDVGLGFRELSSKKLTELLQNLTLREKMKISALNIQKDVEKSQLSGQFNLVYFLKVN